MRHIKIFYYYYLYKCLSKFINYTNTPRKITNYEKNINPDRHSHINK